MAAETAFDSLCDKIAACSDVTYITFWRTAAALVEYEKFKEMRNGKLIKE